MRFRLIRLLVFAGVLSGLNAGCADSECAKDSDCAADQRCSQAGGAFGGAGLCLAVDAFEQPDVEQDAGPDLTPDLCAQETDAELCNRLNLNCGEATITDNCGLARTADCGTCSTPAVCGDTDTPNVCACPKGFTGDGLVCNDIDECQDSLENCASEATCTNTQGAFECACNPGFTGDGIVCESNPPQVAQVVTANGDETLTTPDLEGSNTDLYVAFVNIRTASRTVQSVNGLGLMWTNLAVKCDGAEAQRLEIWTARGEATAGAVTVQLTGQSYAAVASVIRVTNVSAGNATGNVVMANSSATGDCLNGVKAFGYSYDYTPGMSTLILSGVGTRHKVHEPGAGFTELSDETRIGNNSLDASLAVMSGIGSNTPIQINGTFNDDSTWGSISFEVAGP